MREMFSFSYLLWQEPQSAKVLQWNCLDLSFIMRSPKKNKRLWNLESNILLELESGKKKKKNWIEEAQNDQLKQNTNKNSS